MNKTKNFLIMIVGVVVLVVALGFVADRPKDAGKYGPLAQCLKDSGAEYYGAFWCPVCRQQTKMFGGAKDLLPYVECSNPDRSQTQICIDKEIKSYPTWIFKDGSRSTGLLSMESLSEKTACPLPR